MFKGVSLFLLCMKIDLRSMVLQESRQFFRVFLTRGWYFGSLRLIPIGDILPSGRISLQNAELYVSYMIMVGLLSRAWHGLLGVERRISMNITDILVKKVRGEGRLKAYVSVTFNDCFAVHNMKVIDGKNGIFVAMPSRKTNKGDFKDVAHPITVEFRTTLQDAILEAYAQAPEGGDGEVYE